MVAAGRLPLGIHETLTPRQQLGERLILGLRLREGVPAAWIEERVAADPGRLPEVLAAWGERGLLEERAGRIALTEAGFLLSAAFFIDPLESGGKRGGCWPPPRIGGPAGFGGRPSGSTGNRRGPWAPARSRGGTPLACPPPRSATPWPTSRTWAT